MNVLITGGAGFIGRNLVRRLAPAGHRCLVFDRFSPQIHEPGAAYPELQLPGVEVVTADVRDRAALQAALDRCDAVVHLAAETGTGQSMHQVEHYYDVNVRGTALLLDCLTAMGAKRPKKLLLASSRAIYGEGAYRCAGHGLVHPRGRTAAAMDRGLFEPACPQCGGALLMVPTGEDAPAQPTSVYGASKYAQEQLVLLQAGALGLACTALRFQNVYGPGQSLKNPYTGILAIFTNLARRGDTIQIFEDGRESRDFVYVDDVVTALAAALDDPRPGQHVYNVGAGTAVNVLEIATALVRRLDSRSKIVISGAYRVGDIRHNLADISRITRDLDYAPTVGFAAGLEQFVRWALEGPPTDTGYRRSLEELQHVGLFRHATTGSSNGHV